ncbi:Stp1/IreP family PP2C-type Ser/Thr phosphatase [Alicyclobacillus cycloheptanicus]|jgi:protein phosphatase|nr:Stp1/IreP family PP2C-type Ser/Thr phosphatase [Alicyclobacillus cycloheptanicus]WDM02780.1 Stp1/IreP family PP2C-type Ser/Thr phosphatase [Alicyclobacillus cycloheptanicus]
MLYAARSHIGLVRQMNQDGFAVHTDVLPWRLLIVADGMGGASAGEVASQIAVGEVSRVILSRLPEGHVDPAELLREAIFSANQRIWETAKENPAYVGMGTTIVSVLTDGETLVFAHVGDSRGYLWRNHTLQQVTHDHSLVAELVRRGQLTEEEALVHPQRNIVTRSLGTSENSYPDLDILTWHPGDALLLCSDGLSNLVGSDELSTHLAQAASVTSQDEIERIADSLLKLALERGGPDNITLIVAAHGDGGGQA